MHPDAARAVAVDGSRVLVAAEKNIYLWQVQPPSAAGSGGKKKTHDLP